jgi:hypothetical protein
MNVAGHQPATIQSPVPLEHYAEARQAAEFLPVATRSAKQLAREGKLPARPRGDGQRRCWLFLLSELDAWLRARINSACDPCRAPRSVP